MRYRLVTLFPLTILICSILYARRLASISDLFSATIRGEENLSIKHKRDFFLKIPSNDHSDSCTFSEATEEDFRSLPHQAGGKSHEVSSPTVHCHVIRDCPKMATVRVTCVSYSCKTFGLRFSKKLQMTSVSVEEISREIEMAMENKLFTQIDRVQDYMSAICLDGTAKQTTVEIALHSVSPAVCRKGIENKPLVSGNEQSKKNIHFFFLRYLSRSEMETRLPGIFSLLQFVRTIGGSSLHFKKHQATTWREIENLSTFLLGPSLPSEPHSSFLKDLIDSGYCLRLEDLSCISFPEKEQLFSKLISDSKNVCGRKPLNQRELRLDMLCSEGNLTDIYYHNALTSLVADIHGVTENGNLLQPLASATFFNAKHFKNPQILDLALRNVISSLLSFKENIVIILSDVGSPSLLRLDQPVRLQTQASNPLFAIMSSTNLSPASLFSAEQLAKTIFSLREVFFFLKNITQHEKMASYSLRSQLELVAPRNKSIQDSREATCARLQVQPPLICLCERESISYANDTVMVGFAEVLVGLINARLRKGFPRHNQPSRFSGCSQVVGVSFSEVKMRHVSNRKVITMELVMTLEGSNERIARRALMVVWDLDKIAKVDFRLSKISNTIENEAEMLSSASLEDQIEALCQIKADLLSHTAAEKTLLQRLKQTKHFGVKPAVIHMHDNCLYLVLRDFGDSVSVHTSNICRDRQYDVMLHLSLVNMAALVPLPIYASVGHAQTEFLVVIVKISYTMTTFAYKLHPDFNVSYDK